MKFIVMAITAKSVWGQFCSVEEGTTVTSSTYPEANGCYSYTGLLGGYPSFGTSNGAVLPYTYDVGGSGVIITRWVWVYSSSPFMSCDMDVIDGALTGSNPANGAELTGFSSTGTGGDCSEVDVEFSCGCGSSPDPIPTPEPVSPTPAESFAPIQFESSAPTSSESFERSQFESSAPTSSESFERSQFESSAPTSSESSAPTSSESFERSQFESSAPTSSESFESSTLNPVQVDDVVSGSASSFIVGVFVFIPMLVSVFVLV